MNLSEFPLRIKQSSDIKQTYKTIENLLNLEIKYLNAILDKLSDLIRKN